MSVSLHKDWLIEEQDRAFFKAHPATRFLLREPHLSERCCSLCLLILRERQVDGTLARHVLHQTGDN